jgi:hypothetical protein
LFEGLFEHDAKDSPAQLDAGSEVAMLEFWQGGGAPMIAIALFGGLNLLLGAWFAVRPRLAQLPLIGALSASVLCSIAGGTLANLATVGINVPQHPEWRQHTELPLLVMQGFAESMAPGILGFSLLSVTALACALGLWRHGAQTTQP